MQWISLIQERKIRVLELLINKQDKLKTIMLVENGILVEKHEEHENQQRLEGNIYIGKVVNVLKGMRISFCWYWSRKK